MTPRRSTDQKAAILVVDNDPLNIHLVQGYLKDRYDVYGAATLKEALACCADHPPNLILLAMDLPASNGRNACQALKSQTALLDVPIVLVTGRQTPDAEAQCFEAGGADFIAKPLHPTVLHARIQNQLLLAQQATDLQALAYIDSLTGIHNRRSFNEYLAREHRACRRERAPLAIVLLDVDCFNAYNAHYGHLAGDNALRAVATLLQRSLRRPRDFVARFGGEALACVLPHSDLQDATSVAEYLRNQVDDARLPHVASYVKPNLTVSVGTASWIPKPNQDPNELLMAADAGLYQAKARGRNQVCTLPPPSLAS